MNRIINDAMPQKEKEALSLLTSLSIEYRLYEHSAALTMEDCENIGADIGAAHYKNLFLTTRHGGGFYLLLLDVKKRFDSSAVSHALGTSRLCFASSEQLSEKLDLVPGSVTVLGLMCDSSRDVTVVVDRSILTREWVCLHPRVPTASVAIRGAELMRLLNHFDNEVRLLDID